jgi:BlaI family penicillinase repressor
MRKPAPARDIPPPLELLCLNALWNLKEANVSDVRRAVSEKKELAYTTVMTVLDRLVRRGAVSRRKAGRAFLYAPQMSREVMRGLALKEFIESFFDGSEENLRAFLARPRAVVPELGRDNNSHLDTALL